MLHVCCIELQGLDKTSTDWKQQYQDKKGELLRQQQKAEDELLGKQLQEAEQDLRQFRRELLVQRHMLEKNLLQEELNTMQVHKDLAQQMRMRHHRLTAEMELKHLAAHQNLRRQHLESQQQTEWANQMEYNRNKERDLRKKHLMEVRKQPKDLKVRSRCEVFCDKQFMAQRRCKSVALK